MVLSCRGSKHSVAERFDGSNDAGVRIFMFENVTTCGKDNKERDMEIMCHLEGAVFDF